MIKRKIGTHVKRIRGMLNDKWEVFLHEYRFKAIKFRIAVIRKVLVRIWFLILELLGLMLDEFSFIRLLVRREIIDFVMLVFIWEDVINIAKAAE